ncbi:MAG: MBL fold metallo-hydrolase [Clostridiales bacterium]|jgi:glyoxylase-like metal-dependent hydrolase (beta-lactamase superfamily II)|nr:MBL fold metallo-hydrolase [Clostridiales bacterium]
MPESYYRIEETGENAKRITSYENVYVDLIIGSDKALLIDTGHAYGDLKAVIKSLTDKPLIIVNTHGHVDHACGNAQFDEPVFISEKDLDLCAKHTSRDYRARSAQNAEEFLDYRTGKLVRGLPENFDLEKYIAQGAGNLKPISEGERFDLGGATIRAIATPGHTPGSLSFYWEELKWLYVGDAANAFCWLFLPESVGRAALVESLDKIIELNPVRIYASHVPQPLNVDSVRLFKRAAVEAVYENGIPYETPISPAARVCAIDGLTMNDFANPGFASVVIGPDF